MSKRVRRRRGTQAQHDEFTGADGELTVNTTDYSVHAHDGSTAGGFKTYGEGNPPDFSDLTGTSGVFTTSSPPSFSDLTGTSGVFTTSSPPSFSDVTGSISDGQVPESAVTQHAGAINSTDLSDHASAVVELGGDFDAGEEVRCERIGNWVTITAVGGTLTHSSTSTPSSSSGAIPSQFRPNGNVGSVTYITGSHLTEIFVSTSGTFFATHQDWTGTLSAEGSAEQATITYLLT